MALGDAVPQTPWDLSHFHCTSRGEAASPTQRRLSEGRNGITPNTVIRNGGATPRLPWPLSFRRY